MRNPITDTYFGLSDVGKGRLFSFHRPSWGSVPLNGNRAFSLPKLTHCPASISNVIASRAILDGFPVTNIVGKYFAEIPSEPKGTIWQEF